MSKSVALRATGGGRLPKNSQSVRVRRLGDGSTWRRFDSGSAALRAFPKLARPALDALLDAAAADPRDADACADLTGLDDSDAEPLVDAASLSAGSDRDSDDGLTPFERHLKAKSPRSTGRDL